MKPISSTHIARKIRSRLHWRWGRSFETSQTYWEQRYADGGNSGEGSYGKFALLKAEIVNEFIASHNVDSIIEFGCGDGNQLTLAKYPCYTGFDVSETAICMCRQRFNSDSTKTFLLMQEYRGEAAELALSLDVIYHLVEDRVFEDYMTTLFGAAERYVIIYSSDTDRNHWWASAHVKHRKFTSWISRVRSDWRLIDHRPSISGSMAAFYIYEKALPS